MQTVYIALQTVYIALQTVYIALQNVFVVRHFTTSIPRPRALRDSVNNYGFV